MSSSKQKKVWSRVGLIGSFVCSLASVGVSVMALRNNNVRMLELFKEVQDSDQSGVGVDKAVGNLQVFVASHMNATPPKLGSNPGIQLKNSYDRAKQAESDRVSAERTRIYNEAVGYCEVVVPGSRVTERAQCIIDRSSSQPVVERQIVPDLYRYDFVSPRWAPDVAGWMLLISIVLVGSFLLQVMGRLVAKILVTK